MAEMPTPGQPTSLVCTESDARCGGILRLTQVEVDIAAAPDQFQRFVLHRSIPFNRFTRAEISSIRLQSVDKR
jgi:hypothetical protein